MVKILFYSARALPKLTQILSNTVQPFPEICPSFPFAVHIFAPCAHNCPFLCVFLNTVQRQARENFIYNKNMVFCHHGFFTSALEF
jgi:hypothetical protein